MSAEFETRLPHDYTGSSGRWRRIVALANKDFTLDLFERSVVIVLFIVFANRMLGRLLSLIVLQIEHPQLIVPAMEMNIGAILLVVSESLGVVLIVIRRRSATQSSHPLDWVLSFTAVNVPLLTAPAPAGTIIPTEVASMIMFVGLIIQIAGKATLWRSFGIVPANRGIKTVRMYRFVRHPIYAGYALTHLGFVLGFPLLQNALLYLAVLAIQIVRILREEALLKRDPAYRAYAERVPYRLVPGIY